MTLRESAQFIDELRQHYRRLDGLLVHFRDRLSLADCMEFNQPVLALRRLLFASVADPNWVGAGDRERPPGEPGNGCRVADPSPILHLVEDEDWELSTAEGICAPGYLGHGNNL